MPFFATLVQSFYSAAFYRQQRYQAKGYAVLYSATLLLATTIITMLTLLTVHAAQLANLLGGNTPDALVWVAILALAFILRLAMLFGLGIAARFISMRAKPLMDYPAAMRMAAISYTPVAVMDAVAFTVRGIAIGPGILFALGLLMLAATTVATRGE